MHRKLPRLILVALALMLLAGCATTPVQPWERARLARWDMRWDPDPAQSALSQHTYFSKEGSNGSVGAAGGGCGCN
jgi:outer membrane biogenesis lipoprotein LolB